LTLLQVLKTENLETLIGLTKITIKETQDQKLRELLKAKLEFLQEEHNRRGYPKAIVYNINFVGFYTYDLRVKNFFINLSDWE